MKSPQFQIPEIYFYLIHDEPLAQGGQSETALDAALDSGGRYAGAVVEPFKFWKWPQNFADFIGGQVGTAIYDTESWLGWDENVGYLKYQFGTAEGWGSLAGSALLGSAAPQIPKATTAVSGFRLADYFRTGNTVVSNQLVNGPGATGATVTWAIKGGGPSMNFHFHVHKYNWNKPSLWFKQTEIIPPPKP